MWGDPETITDKLIKRRLEWLGHLARMEDYRIPKRTLFGWLPQKRPPGGPRKRWRDVVKADLKMIGVLDTWYTSALHGRNWDRLYTEGIQSSQRLAREALPTVQCMICGRTFRREQDRARHKCTEERSKPVHQQQGALQCSTCGKWLRSRGGLAVHNCQELNPAITVNANNRGLGRAPTVDNSVHCSVCQRTFNRPGDFKRHKCLAVPIEEQQGAIHCTKCQCWFHSKGGFTVHKCTAAEAVS